MTLIELYIQEVVRRLPEKTREDIALELRSTIEDMLPDDYSEEDVKEVLEKLGNPVTLANGYRDWPSHLIGPRYFDVYVTLLKMILPIGVAVALISMIPEHFIGYSGEQPAIRIILILIGEGIWRMIEVGIHIFFWLTLVFAILERADKEKDQQPLTMHLQKWTPDDLKNIPYVPKKKVISKFEVFGSFLWTAIWGTLYFYAYQIVGIYERSGNRLESTPIFNQNILLSYWPIVVIIIASEIGLSLYKLIKGQWTQGIAIYNAVLQVIGTITFTAILLNPNVLSNDFITYMTNLFTISANQFKAWIIGGGIFIYMLSAAISVFDGFRKARIR